MSTSLPVSRERGSVLLSVLWIVAILSVIAFGLAMQVRGETERSGTLYDQTQAYYVATAGVDLALLQVLWTQNYGATLYKPQITRFPLEFPEGRADVEILPENAKLDLNQATPLQVNRLLAALEVPPGPASEIAAAIVDWRSGGANASTQFDSYYAQLRPSFRSPHASFRETEELLMVKGMTPEIYYGSYRRNQDGRLVALGGLRDCVSSKAPGDIKDVNAVEPAVLVALGAPPQGVAALMGRRRQGPISQVELPQLLPLLGPAAGFVGIGGNSIFSLRSTGRPRLADGRLSDTRRSVAATFKLNKAGITPGLEVLRWYDHTWVNEATVSPVSVEVPVAFPPQGRLQ